jgi:hypothetical protein
VEDRTQRQRHCNFQQIMAKTATFWFNSGSGTLWFRISPFFNADHALLYKPGFISLTRACAELRYRQNAEARITERLHVFEEDDDMLMAMARECLSLREHGVGESVHVLWAVAGSNKAGLYSTAVVPKGPKFDYDLAVPLPLSLVITVSRAH